MRICAKKVHASRVPFFEMLEIKMYVNVTDEQKHAAPSHREEIFSALYDKTERPLTGRHIGSGILFRAEVALIFQPFLTHAALVVLAVWRRIGRDAVLPCRIGRYRRAVLAATRPGIALRMAR
jgi:hypothetical protein